MPTSYDTMGINYSDLRKPDPRIAAHINRALGDAKTVLNVGAGTGSYEPTDRRVTAVEPSSEMISQRSADAAPVVQGNAEDLPFDDESFDASMAILTVHHWADKAKGLQEMRRVTRGPIVLLTFDPVHGGCWLTDYIPELVSLDEKQMPKIIDYADWLGLVNISTVPIPHDCTDGFLYAYWRRPCAYLDPQIRAGMSSFWKIDSAADALSRLETDLDSGKWEEQYSELLSQQECDVGYRLVQTL